MGIDARIVARLKGDKPSEEQLKEWSWQLCRSVGARHFFIQDGLPPAEYQKIEKAWHEAFNRHPEYGALEQGRNSSFDFFSQPESERQRSQEILERIQADVKVQVGELPQERRLAIDLAEANNDQPGIVPGKLYLQDGSDVVAGPGEWLLEVSLFTRYYGVGYERGDLLVICAVAEWLEANLPNVTVYYGGDSSGVCLTRFDEKARAKLRRHLYSKAGRDYFNYRSSLDSGLKRLPPPCSLCPGGVNRSTQYSWGSHIGVSCAGCGINFVSSDNGQTWQKEKRDA